MQNHITNLMTFLVSHKEWHLSAHLLTFMGFLSDIHGHVQLFYYIVLLLLIAAHIPHKLFTLYLSQCSYTSKDSKLISQMNYWSEINWTQKASKNLRCEITLYNNPLCSLSCGTSQTKSSCINDWLIWRVSWVFRLYWKQNRKAQLEINWKPSFYLLYQKCSWG